MLRLLVSVGAIALVAAHGEMTFPPTRFNTSMRDAGYCPGHGCFWFSQGCQPGCSKCTDTFSGDTCSEPGGTMKPVIGRNETDLLTYFYDGSGDYTKDMPWRSPGHSPVFSPCGLGGGGVTRHPGNGAVAPTAKDQGLDGRTWDATTAGTPAYGIKTVWPAGSAQDVAWSITANHGGGYAYRLCPKGGEEGGDGSESEACFQKGHLEFVGDSSWIQYGDDAGNRTAIPAHRTSKGTAPAGSTWTRNPIPACQYPDGVGTVICRKPMFEPPLPGLFGYGGAACSTVSAGGGGGCTPEQSQAWHDKFNFNIMDKVRVPQDLAAGEYVLSFRWDCEQTPQVWTQCSDITVTA